MQCPRNGLKVDQVRRVALTLNTADYCARMTSRLADYAITILDDELAESVDLENEENQFYDQVLAPCVSLLLEHVFARCHRPFSKLKRKNWMAVKVSGRMRLDRVVCQLRSPTLAQRKSAAVFCVFCCRSPAEHLITFLALNSHCW